MDEPCSALDPDRHGEDRGFDPRAERALHDRHRDAQHAAGGAGVGSHGVLLSRRADRVRSDREDLHHSREARDRGLHHGSFRLTAGRAHDDCTPIATSRASSRRCSSSCCGWAASSSSRSRDAIEALVERDSDLAHERHRPAIARSTGSTSRSTSSACKLLALHQPAARDLRFITTALKITTDLERIGDMAVNICERALELNEEPPLKPYIDIPRMAQGGAGDAARQPRRVRARRRRSRGAT